MGLSQAGQLTLYYFNIGKTTSLVLITHSMLDLQVYIHMTLHFTQDLHQLVYFTCFSLDNTADVFFELRGEIYPNNSAITITDIGERGMALFCKTNREGCCRTPPNRAGQFYYPNGDQVRNPRVSQMRGQGFYRTRRTQHIRLHRRPGINTPTGVYSCEIPDANGATQRLFINLTAGR